MLQKNTDERLSEWSELRKSLDLDLNPLQSVNDFWSKVPVIIHNHKIDPFNPKSWPTPWEIIADYKFDDFTLALMIGYTLKFSNRYKDHKIQVRTMVDYDKNQLYNIVVINDDDVLNYSRENAVKANELKQSLYLENIVDIIFPR